MLLCITKTLKPGNQTRNFGYGWQVATSAELLFTRPHSLKSINSVFKNLGNGKYRVMHLAEDSSTRDEERQHHHSRECAHNNPHNSVVHTEGYPGYPAGQSWMLKLMLQGEPVLRRG